MAVAPEVTITSAAPAVPNRSTSPSVVRVNHGVVAADLACHAARASATTATAATRPSTNTTRTAVIPGSLAGGGGCRPGRWCG